MRYERLGEKITQIRGISYKPNDISTIPLPEYVPILKANNIQEDGIVIKDLIYIHKSKVRPEQFIKKGDLLLAASSGSKDIVGKNIYFESDFHGSFGAFCKLVRPNENINPRYLATFFKSVPYKRHIRKLLSGALINNLKNEYIDSLLIPEISDTEQLNIANLLSKAETLITQRKETLRLLDEYLKSTFSEMFGDPVRNEKEWKTKSIEQLVKKEKFSLKRGPFGGALKKEIFVSSGYLVYEQFHALNNDFTFARYFIDEAKFQELRGFEVKPGDIIVSCSGVYLGKLAIVPEGAKQGIINQALLKISLDNRIIENVFFVFVFSNENFKRKFYGSVIGTGIPNFPSMDDFKKFNFIYPPIDLQTQFAQIVEKTEALKNQYQQSLQELENLYGSLSQRAFRGELSKG